MRTELYGTIMGVISGLVNCLRVIQSIVNLIHIFKTENKTKNHNGDISQGEPTFSDNDEIAADSNIYDILRARQYFTLVFGLIMCVTCFLLIFGVRKRRPILLIPWLVLALVGVIVIVLLIFFDGYTLTGTQVYSNVLYIVIQSLIWPTIFFIWMELRMDYVQIDYPINKVLNKRQTLHTQTPAAATEASLSETAASSFSGA